MSEGPAQQDNDSQARIAALEAELATLRQARDQAEQEREQYRKLYTLVLYELERLKRQSFGRKAESVDPKQVQLAFSPVFRGALCAEAGAADAHSDVEYESDHSTEERV